MSQCPLCKAPVRYEGLFSIECTGSECANFKPGAPLEPPRSPYGSWWWARDKQREGYVLEYAVPGQDWEKLEDDIRNLTDPDDDGRPRYRLMQSEYERSSRHARHSKYWAIDQTRYREVLEVSPGHWEITGIL